MERSVLKWAGVASLVVFTGCATKPKIETGKFSTPRTVVIADIPDVNPIANIGIFITPWPEPYFSKSADYHFVVNNAAKPLPGVADYTAAANQIVIHQITTAPQPVSVGVGAAMGAAGGLVGALIQANAEATQKKAAEFPNLVRRATPRFDLRTDFMDALRKSLEARNIQVKIISETRNHVPRLYWPAKSDDGKALPTGAFSQSPAVDADLLVQVSPIASYAAPGPLNNYARQVGVGLALFDGRTRKFIGWQAIAFRAPDSNFEYARYDSLAADVANAGPALQRALLSLVPEVASIVSGGQPVVAGVAQARLAAQAPVATQAPAAVPLPLAAQTNTAAPAASVVSITPAAAALSTANGSATAAPAEATPEPAAVAVATAVAPAGVPPNATTDKLRQLQKLYEGKQISADEYGKRRREILSGL